MSRTAPSLILGAVVAMATAVACSSSSSPPAPSAGDSGASDGSACGAPGCPVDAALDVAPFDTGWVCPLIPETDVGADCDACVQARCDAAWCACAQGQVVVDAGPTGCLAILACTLGCPADGGGSAPASCADAGCAAASSPTDAQNARTLLSCVAQSCAAACAGLTTLEI